MQYLITVSANKAISASHASLRTSIPLFTSSTGKSAFPPLQQPRAIKAARKILSFRSWWLTEPSRRCNYV